MLDGGTWLGLLPFVAAHVAGSILLSASCVIDAHNLGVYRDLSIAVFISLGADRYQQLSDYVFGRVSGYRSARGADRPWQLTEIGY